MFDESLWNVTHGNSLDETASSIVPRGRQSGGRYNIVELSLAKRRAVELALRKSEEHLRQIIDNLPAADK